MTTAPRFEDRLLVQLRQVVADRPAPAAARSRGPQRTRLALAGAGVAAATAAVAVVATSNDANHSAYALKARADGAVTVSIHSLRDANGLERSLRDAGIPAVVDYAPTGSGACAGSGAPAAPPRGAGGESGATFHTGSDGAGPSLTQHGKAPDGERRQRATMSFVSTRGGDATFTIDPGTLGPGERVYITTSTGAVTSIAMAIGAHKPAAPCVPAPPAP